jgi:hypothetical protein
LNCLPYSVVRLLALPYVEIGEFDAEALRFRPAEALPCFPAK